MKERQLLTVFVIFISLSSACALSDCGTYSCPRPIDPPDRTRCCFWFGNSCCRPGGNTCRDSSRFVRNYCPGPNDGKLDSICCSVNGVPKCCSVWLLVGILVPIIILVSVMLVVCCCWSRCPLAQWRLRRQMQHAGAPNPVPSGIAMSQSPQGYGYQ